MADSECGFGAVCSGRGIGVALIWAVGWPDENVGTFGTIFFDLGGLLLSCGRLRMLIDGSDWAGIGVVTFDAATTAARMGVAMITTGVWGRIWRWRRAGWGDDGAWITIASWGDADNDHFFAHAVIDRTGRGDFFV